MATPDEGWLFKGIKVGGRVVRPQDLGSILTRLDLSGCLFLDCQMSSEGPSHLRPSANYTGVCSIYVMRYRGKIGFSAHARIKSHEAQIRACSEQSIMAQLLMSQEQEN